MRTCGLVAAEVGLGGFANAASAGRAAVAINAATTHTASDDAFTGTSTCGFPDPDIRKQQV
jgi:hypothetical protein